MRGFHASVAALAASLVCAAMPARADDLAEFWRGKSVAMHIPAGPGGGYDTYGRLVARHLGKHIPGNPAITPQNVPGAGGFTIACSSTMSTDADERFPIFLKQSQET